MSKQHRDFVVYVRNGVHINALVAFSRDIVTPATQGVEAFTTEHLTVAYLDPSAASPGAPSGDQLRNSIKIEFDVPPLVEGGVNGWYDPCRECGGGPCKLGEIPGEAVSSENATAPEFAHSFTPDGNFLIAEKSPGETDEAAIARANTAFQDPRGVYRLPLIVEDAAVANAAPQPNPDAKLGFGNFRKPWADLYDEEKTAATFPTWDGIVTSSGKTQAELDADHAAQVEAPASDVVQNDPAVVAAVAEANEPTAEGATAPTPSIE